MDSGGNIKEDCNLPEAEHLLTVKKEIQQFFESGKNEVLVIVLQTLGKQQVDGVREGNPNE